MAAGQVQLACLGSANRIPARDVEVPVFVGHLHVEHVDALAVLSVAVVINALVRVALGPITVDLVKPVVHVALGPRDCLLHVLDPDEIDGQLGPAHLLGGNPGAGWRQLVLPGHDAIVAGGNWRLLRSVLRVRGRLNVHATQWQSATERRRCTPQPTLPASEKTLRPSFLR